jgi:hypothetical protein
MFRRTTDEQEAITRTWAEVEGAIGSLRGRKFYGVFDPTTNEYRSVCNGGRGTMPRLSDWRAGRFQAAGMFASGSRESRLWCMS